jgi:hypothetical protein
LTFDYFEAPAAPDGGPVFAPKALALAADRPVDSPQRRYLLRVPASLDATLTEFAHAYYVSKNELILSLCQQGLAVLAARDNVHMPSATRGLGLATGEPK